MVEERRIALQHPRRIARVELRIIERDVDACPGRREDQHGEREPHEQSRGPAERAWLDGRLGLGRFVAGCHPGGFSARDRGRVNARCAPHAPAADPPPMRHGPRKRWGSHRLRAAARPETSVHASGSSEPRTEPVARACSRVLSPSEADRRRVAGRPREDPRGRRRDVLTGSQLQNVAASPSERLKPAPPADGLRYQHWK